MPYRGVRARRELQAEQATGGVERRFDHAIEAEIRFDGGLVEIAHAPAELFGVVAPVPRLKLEIAAVFLDQRLHRVAVEQCSGARRPPDCAKQIAHRRRRLRHGVVEPIMGEIRIAEEPRAFGAQPNHLGDDRFIVG